MRTFTCSTMYLQNMLSSGSAGNRAGVEDVLVLIAGSRSSDMRRTLEEATRARRAGLRIVVVGLGTWINQLELAGVASYPYRSSRLLLPSGYGSLPSIRDRLRNIICNSKCNLRVIAVNRLLVQ